MEELLPKTENLFEFLGVHREMLSDSVRVESYKVAISNAIKPGDVVVDVGTGTGLLAFLCIQAGARKVYAIESQNIINTAREIARENQLEDRIIFLRGDSRDLTIPEKADAIISEVIGHCVLDENMLDSIMDSRKRFLKSTGYMIPERARLIFSPVENQTAYRYLNFWRKKFCNINWTPAWKKSINTIYVIKTRPEQLLADPSTLIDIDFSSFAGIDLNCELEFTIKKEGKFLGFAAWFDVLLTHKGNVRISTDPSKPSTHWQSAFFPTGEVVNIKKGDTVSFWTKCYSTGDSIEWEWGGYVKRAKKRIAQFSQSTELY